MVDKEVKKKERSGLSLYLSMALSILLTAYIKQILQENFEYFQELLPVMDFGLYVIILAPLYYLMSKFFDWLYSGRG